VEQLLLQARLHTRLAQQLSATLFVVVQMMASVLHQHLQQHLQHALARVTQLAVCFHEQQETPRCLLATQYPVRHVGSEFEKKLHPVA
jgi:DNA-binding FrmR family transcriptional regulator